MLKYRNQIVVLLALLLVVCLAMPVLAAETDYVIDEAGLLTDTQKAQLEGYAEEISEYYGCGVYILTVRDYREYGGGSVRGTAEQYFLDQQLGLGSGQNGVMLFLSMAERDYALIAHGDLGNTAFTDYGKDLLSEEFLDDFRYDEWFSGFSDYLSCSEDFLLAAAEGTPVDVGQGGDSILLSPLMVLLVSAVIAGVSCGIMVATMKSAARRTHADDYIQQKGIRITGQHDRFLNRTVVRQRIESSSSSGGSRVNSRGFSGKSGKF